MNNIDWDNIRYFIAAARTHSLSAASRALDSNQPTVGRHIDALEAQLGLRLFQRHSTGLTLTEDGQRLLASAELMEEGAADMLRTSQSDASALTGTVRIAAPEGLGVSVLTPSLPALYKQHPLLDIVLEPSVSSADLKRGQADLRYGSIGQPLLTWFRADCVKWVLAYMHPRNIWKTMSLLSQSTRCTNMLLLHTVMNSRAKRKTTGWKN